VVLLKSAFKIRTALNKDIAIALNKEEDRKITLSEFKKFIKDFYDEAFPATLN
jgi:hypothetical protein